MTPPRSRIAMQLAAILALVLVLLISFSTLFALRSLNEANLATREKHLGSEAGLLADQLETFHGSLRDSTQRLAGLFEQRFSSGLQVRSDERVAVGSLQTPALYLGATRLSAFAESPRCRSVLQRFSQVGAADRLLARQVGQSARDLEYAMGRAQGQPETFAGVFQPLAIRVAQCAVLAQTG